MPISVYVKSTNDFLDSTLWLPKSNAKAGLIFCHRPKRSRFMGGRHDGLCRGFENCHQQDLGGRSIDRRNHVLDRRCHAAVLRGRRVACAFLQLGANSARQCGGEIHIGIALRPASGKRPSGCRCAQPYERHGKTRTLDSRYRRSSCSDRPWKTVGGKHWRDGHIFSG